MYKLEPQSVVSLMLLSDVAHNVPLFVSFDGVARPKSPIFMQFSEFKNTFSGCVKIIQKYMMMNGAYRKNKSI